MYFKPSVLVSPANEKSVQRVFKVFEVLIFDSELEFQIQKMILLLSRTLLMFPWICSFIIFPVFFYYCCITQFTPTLIKVKSLHKLIFKCFPQSEQNVSSARNFPLRTKFPWELRTPHTENNPLIKNNSNLKVIQKFHHSAQLAIPWWEVYLSGFKDFVWTDGDLSHHWSYEQVLCFAHTLKKITIMRQLFKLDCWSSPILILPTPFWSIRIFPETIIMSKVSALKEHIEIFGMNKHAISQEAQEDLYLQKYILFKKLKGLSWPHHHHHHVKALNLFIPLTQVIFCKTSSP